jgi:hypothetical protein
MLGAGVCGRLALSRSEEERLGEVSPSRRLAVSRSDYNAPSDTDASTDTPTAAPLSPHASIRQHTPASVSVRQRTRPDACADAPTAAPLSPHTNALFQPVQARPGAVFGQMHRSGSQ